MDAMKKAQEFTSVAKDLQEQLKNTEIEATVRGGQVTVTMTAQQVPLRIEVTDELVAMGSAEVRFICFPVRHYCEASEQNGASNIRFLALI